MYTDVSSIRRRACLSQEHQEQHLNSKAEPRTKLHQLLALISSHSDSDQTSAYLIERSHHRRHPPHLLIINIKKDPQLKSPHGRVILFACRCRWNSTLSLPNSHTPCRPSFSFPTTTALSLQITIKRSCFSSSHVKVNISIT